MARRVGSGRWGLALLLVAGVVAPVAVPGPAVAQPGRSGTRLLAAAAQGAGAAGTGSPTLTAQSTAQAAALAASSGQPVEVMADRSDWSQTFAEPGGGFSSQISVGPVRVEMPDGSWVPVDTTLSAQPDGSVAPAATVPGLVLSGGGPGALMTVSQATGDPAGSVSVSWPFGPLPAPSLSGATATYANVLPGVNLLVTAEPTGVDAVLQVMSAAAAVNPALAAIRFPLSAPGLTLAADGQGGVTMTDAAGDALFTELPAQMWDSAALAAAGPVPPGSTGVSAPGSGPMPAGLAGPVPGDHVGVAAVSVGAGSVSLAPVASVLAGSSTVYPVYIDPGITYTHTQTGWLDVAHDFNGYSSATNNGSPCGAFGGSWHCWGDWDYENPSGGIRAGVWCNPPQYAQYQLGPPPPPSNICDSRHTYPDSWWGVYRSYMNFNLPSELAGADYVDAQLSVDNVWSYSCSEGSGLELWQTAEASQGSYWGNRPTELNWQDSATSSYGNGCNPGGIILNATGALTNAADNSASEVTLELRASLNSEGASPPDLTNWRRFQATGNSCAGPGTNGGYPCLQVFWMHKPDQANETVTEGRFDPATGGRTTGCSGNVNNPDNVNTTTPWLDGVVSDQDSGLPSFKGSIKWTEVDGLGSGSGTFSGGDVQSSDGSFRSQVPSGTFADDGEYEWQAQGVATAKDTVSGASVTEAGQWSSPCYVQIDLPSYQSLGGTVPDVVGTAGVCVGANSGCPTSWTVGNSGTLTFTDPEYAPPPPALSTDSDVVGYLYSVGSSDPSQYVQATNGTGQVPIKAYTEHTEQVFVEAVDAAGNRGPLRTDSAGTVIPSYQFTASARGNVGTLAYWPLNNTPADKSGLGNGLAPGAAFACGSSPNTPGYTCSLGFEADTSAGVVSPEAGFTVSAWATTGNWPCANSTCVVMSEDDPKNSGNGSVFWLGYQGAGGTGVAGYPGQTANCPCWVFEVWPSAGSTTPTVAAISATTGQQQGDWTQLTGVFDPTSPLTGATLYVNGPRQTLAGPGQQQVQGPWALTTPGIVRLAPLGPPGSPANSVWAGNVSDACVIFGPLSQQVFPGQAQSDISTLWDGGAADGCKAIYNLYH